MLRFVAVVSLVLGGLVPSGARAQPQQVLYPGLSGQPLLDVIRADFTPDSTLGYDIARDSLFAYQQRTTGHLTCVYTGYSIVLTPGADPSTDAFLQGLNTEHTWPQSMGASVEPSRSDMHHLFPTRDDVNSARSNHPYGEVPDPEADAWYRGAASQSTQPGVVIDEWSERDNQSPTPPFVARFEPREDHAGNAARAVFYYRALYPDRVGAAGSDGFFEAQRPDLLAWSYQDPVDAVEDARSQWIASWQGTSNPFVLDSTLARRAYGQRIDVGGGATPGTALVWVNELHYDNQGTDVGEFVEIAVPAGIDPASVTVTLYNGNGGQTYDTLQGLSFAQGATSGGVTLYTFTFVGAPVSSLQNGAPDGIAVSVEGEVVQFLSYEGLFTAGDGPAMGLESTEIGVAETGTTPAGQSLQLRGTGSAATDFTWMGPATASSGAVNSGQTFVPVATELPPVAEAGPTLHLIGPNPSRTTTTLRLTLTAPAAYVRVEAFDVLGRRVAVLADGLLGAGPHALTLDVGLLTPGVYVVRAMGDKLGLSRTLTVVR